MTASVSLAEWSERLALGDEAALAELYRRYAGSALCTALSVLHLRAEAEDVVQQTFLEVWQKATRYQPARSHPGTWITRIARARAIDRLRTLKTSASALEGLALEPTFDAIRRSADAEIIRGALEALPTEQARVLELAFYKGLSHFEIADATGVSLGTAKTRLRLGIYKLSTALAGRRRPFRERKGLLQRGSNT